MNETRAAFNVGCLAVSVFETKQSLGREAARQAAAIMQDAIRARGSARVIFAAADSQLEMIANLVATPGIHWQSVEAFHMDEYVDLPTSHPESFGGWVKRNVLDKVPLGKIHYISGAAPDLAAECQRYANLLTSSPIDLCLMGIGENGHIAFNDPHEADFSDPHIIKVVTLDERCRLQQVGEGHWPNLSSVPGSGITITCPALMRATHLICSVPGAQKAEAVRNSLEGPIAPSCPGSLIRTHSHATLFLDSQSASLLAEKV